MSQQTWGVFRRLTPIYFQSYKFKASRTERHGPDNGKYGVNVDVLNEASRSQVCQPIKAQVDVTVGRKPIAFTGRDRNEKGGGKSSQESTA